MSRYESLATRSQSQPAILTNASNYFRNGFEMEREIEALRYLDDETFSTIFPRKLNEFFSSYDLRIYINVQVACFKVGKKERVYFIT